MLERERERGREKEGKERNHSERWISSLRRVDRVSCGRDVIGICDVLL